MNSLEAYARRADEATKMLQTLQNRLDFLEGRTKGNPGGHVKSQPTKPLIYDKDKHDETLDPMELEMISAVRKAGTLDSREFGHTHHLDTNVCPLSHTLVKTQYRTLTQKNCPLPHPQTRSNKSTLYTGRIWFNQFSGSPWLRHLQSPNHTYHNINPRRHANHTRR